MPSPTFTITADPTYVNIQRDKGVPTFVDQYTLAVNNGVTATSRDALLALEAQFPAGTPDSQIATATVMKCAITAVKSPSSCWVGQVTYTTLTYGNSPAAANDYTALLNLPARIESITSDFYQVVSEVDQYGDPICNSAGDMFDPPGTIDLPRLFVVISKYKKSYVASDYIAFFGILNGAAYNVPGLGQVAERSLRCLRVLPATGYQPSMTIPVTGVSGTFAAGDAVTWPGGGAGSVVSLTGSTLTILNPTLSISNTTLITGPSGTATASATVLLPPVKTLWVFEYRPDGFDLPQPDKGTRGYWSDGSNITKAHIFTQKDHTEVSSPVILHLGAPVTTADYCVNNPKFTATSQWNTTKDALAARVTAGHVTRTTSSGTPAVDMITFERLEQNDFSGIGL